VNTRGPSLMIWISTGRCNLRCKHCYASRFLKEEQLSLKGFEKILDEALEIGLGHVSISGGEPLVRNDILDILKLIREKGLTASLVTNATLITSEIARALKEMDISVYVSIDGYRRETHERIRGYGSWSALMKGIRRLKEQSVSFSTVMAVSKINYVEVKGFLVMSEEMGADSACIIPVMPSGRATADIILSPWEIREVIREADEYSSSYGYPVGLWCMPFARLYAGSCWTTLCRTLEVVDLSPSGDLMACDVLDIKLSNALKEGFKIAWMRYSSSDIIKELVHPRELPTPCQNCPIAAICKGGCFARAYLLRGDFKGPDPLCPRAYRLREGDVDAS